MSVDFLQDKIRKLKNPSMVDFFITPDKLPAQLLEGRSEVQAYGLFCRDLLEGLKNLVPAVRFSMGTFSLYGPEGLKELSETLRYAKEQGYYVLLDAPETLSHLSAELTARMLTEGAEFPCDGILISAYLGSDILKAYVPYCKKNQKSLFVLARTANRSAAEIQDLLSGSRLVHSASAGIINRFGENLIGKCGYSKVAMVCAVGAANCTRELRRTYPKSFLLMDGYDYPGANNKKCKYGFDEFGHGAIACAGMSVTAAWQEQEDTGEDYVVCAVEAAEKMRRNLARYITVL